LDGDRISTRTMGSISIFAPDGGAQVIPISGISQFSADRTRGITPGSTTTRHLLSPARRGAVRR
jgi:hypothetical protein